MVLPDRTPAYGFEEKPIVPQVVSTPPANRHEPQNAPQPKLPQLSPIAQRTVTPTKNGTTQPDLKLQNSLAPDVCPSWRFVLSHFGSLANEVNKTPRVGLTSGARLAPE